MYGQGETAKAYSEANRDNRYLVQREIDGFKREVGEFDTYMEALNAAIDEGNSNTASYYAKVRIISNQVTLLEKSFIPGWTSKYKGD